MRNKCDQSNETDNSCCYLYTSCKVVRTILAIIQFWFFHTACHCLHLSRTNYTFFYLKMKEFSVIFLSERNIANIVLIQEFSTQVKETNCKCSCYFLLLKLTSVIHSSRMRPMFKQKIWWLFKQVLLTSETCSSTRTCFPWPLKYGSVLYSCLESAN